jgi:hypothetical protein
VAKHFVAHYGGFLIGKPVCRSFVIDKFLVKGCFLRCEIRCFYEILFRLLFGTRRAAASVPKNQYKTFNNLLYIYLLLLLSIPILCFIWKVLFIWAYFAYTVYLDIKKSAAPVEGERHLDARGGLAAPYLR